MACILRHKLIDKKITLLISQQLDNKKWHTKLMTILTLTDCVAFRETWGTDKTKANVKCLSKF